MKLDVAKKILKRIVQWGKGVFLCLLGVLFGLVISFYYPPTWLFDFLSNIEAGTAFPKDNKSCSNFNAVKGVSKNVFRDGTFEMQRFLSETGEKYKWREHKGLPYVEYTDTLGFEIHLPGNNYADLLNRYDDNFVQAMVQEGFTISEINNIPYYKYPEGWQARKVGFVKDGTNYLTGLFEQEILTGSKNGKDTSSEAKPIETVLRVRCSNPTQEERQIYEKYIKSIDKDAFPAEAVISFIGEVDSVKKISEVDLFYPGAPLWGISRELWYTGEDKWTRISTDTPKPECKVVESLKKGLSMLCFDEGLRIYRLSK